MNEIKYPDLHGKVMLPNNIPCWVGGDEESIFKKKVFFARN